MLSVDLRISLWSLGCLALSLSLSLSLCRSLALRHAVLYTCWYMCLYSWTHGYLSVRVCRVHLYLPAAGQSAKKVEDSKDRLSRTGRHRLINPKPATRNPKPQTLNPKPALFKPSLLFCRSSSKSHVSHTRTLCLAGIRPFSSKIPRRRQSMPT